MKTLIVLLAVLMATSQVFGLGKKKEDPKDAQIASLTHQLDSVSKEMKRYIAMYDTLQVKVFHYNFAPERTSLLIDSLRMVPKDSTFIKSTTALADSVAVLKKENASLKGIISTSNNEAAKNKAFMTQEEIDRAKIIDILNQLRQLVDNKILSEAEFIALKKKYIDKL
jgi:hypothetical protein